MSFQSLDRVFQRVINQPGWETQRQFHHLLREWQGVVKPKIAQQTRPLYISRKILWIATSSSVWAQHLTFKRHQILKQLNAKLALSLVDIRFSTAQWHHQSNSKSQNNFEAAQSSSHPSSLPHNLPNPVPTASSNQVQAALQNWLSALEVRSQYLPTCPQCQCPTPEGELQRWQVCAICATQEWQG